MKKLVFSGVTVTIVSLSIIGYFFSKAFNANASEFDHTVSVALFTVADTMSEKASVEKRSPNLFYVTTNSAVSNQVVDTLIQNELISRNIRLDYELCIYNAEDDTLVYGNYIKTKEAVFNHELTCENTGGIKKNFAVLFPSRTNHILAQNDMWIIFLFGLLIVSWSYYYIIGYFRNGSLVAVTGTQIKLGNSCLDFQNQNLTVNNHSYRLTYKENQILKLLFENPNQVVDREVFLNNIWKKDGFFVARSMDVFISRVRKYLQMDQNIRIENLRSIGYRLNVNKRS